MRLFVPGPDGRPCIWPLPKDCLWNGERFNQKEGLTVWGEELFSNEAQGLAERLDLLCPAGARLGDSSSCIRLARGNSEALGEEGYALDVTEKGATIKAASRRGAFYGCQTLLQLLMNSPDTSIHGVRITDRPVNAIREAEAILPQRDDIPRFKRFVDFLANYKYNRVVLPLEEQYHDLGQGEIQDVLQYMKSRHIEVLYIPAGQTAGQFTAGRSTGSEDPQDHMKMRLLGYIRNSNKLWGAQAPAGDAFRDSLDRVALQLYPIERDRIECAEYPSSTSTAFKALDIRAFYNAPLYRLSWYPDDYDFTYLDKAGFMNNSVPFCLFQGVGDLRLENGFILAGNGWNEGIFEIPVKTCVRSLSFLHSYIIHMAEAKKVGNYIIRYYDGTSEIFEIKYGRDIIHWNAALTGGGTAYGANPAMAGITFYGTPFTIHSAEWVNPKPEMPVASVDVIPEEGCEAGGIALFGITGTIESEFPLRRRSL